MDISYDKCTFVSKPKARILKILSDNISNGIGNTFQFFFSNFIPLLNEFVQSKVSRQIYFWSKWHLFVAIQVKMGPKKPWH